MSAARPAVFLDRDGVLNALVTDPDSGLPESPLTVADVRLLEGIAPALSSLRTAGYVLVCVTNQPAAAKGKVSVHELEAIQLRVAELLAEADTSLDAWRMCLHHPRGTVARLSRDCDCRKPAPGMLLEAARELDLELSRSWMLGDTDADVLAGQAAGCRTVLIEQPASAHKRSSAPEADLLACDLVDAVAQLLARSGSG